MVFILLYISTSEDLMEVTVENAKFANQILGTDIYIRSKFYV